MGVLIDLDHDDSRPREVAGAGSRLSSRRGILHAAVDSERELLRRVGELAADYLESLDTRPVTPRVGHDEIRRRLAVDLPGASSDPLEVVAALAAGAEPGLVASQGGRYFGFVTGASLPAALAADWLVSAWDQNTMFAVMSPASAVIEETAGRWVGELLGLPDDCSFAFTTGCQMAHFTCLAAARHEVLSRVGWDVAADGLAGSPPIAVVAGSRRHATLDRALRFLGIGRRQIVEVPSDDQGRMRSALLVEALRSVKSPMIVCAQAGEVNTGAFDDLEAAADAAHGAGAWLHVDGAFGLWAAASPTTRALVRGHDQADSWALDAHKWLNVPYDCGIAFCAHPDAHRSALGQQAAYYVFDPDAAREATEWTPESSRRARAIPVYAAIRQLGRSGVAELVERCCAHARAVAQGLSGIAGCTVLNEVVLNQVLVRFDDDATTRAVLRGLQESGELWLGGTTWDDRPAIRISISSWRTTESDIARAVAAFERASTELARASRPAL